MKKFDLFRNSLLAMVAVAGLFIFSGCDTDDNTPDGPVLPTVINGAITENTTWKADTEYVIAGGVHVKDGVTLTIEPGVIVKSDPEEAIAYLLVERGGELNAVGTANSPIIFTSGNSSPERGDWGGIILNGKAPINKGAEATSEVGDVKYGGTVATDNSGHIEYVRVEYTGNAINDKKEHNGFTFNGVGNGTTVKNLQVFMGNDDGFEFFGGTVNASNLAAYGCKDDCFDWTYGWSGTGENWTAIQSSDVGDRGIEADNNGSSNNAAPYSNPVLRNITLIGNGRTVEKDGVTKTIPGVKLREGTKGTIENLIIKNFSGAAIEVEHEETIKNAESGALSVDGFKVESVGSIWNFKGVSDAERLREIKTNFILKNDVQGADLSWLGTWVKGIDAVAGNGNIPEAEAVIYGEITNTVRLVTGKTYTISGGVHVKEGATIVIEKGVTVKSNPDEAIAYLLIERGAKIDAQGTESEMIVFTSGEENPERGDWGGIILNGKAPINKGEEATAEVGDVKYGGTATDDNSGIMKYVRVEYTGNAINDKKEHNGFTFNGVGSGTVLEYLQAFMGGDDGFEFFGGTVNATNLVSTGSKDDCFDWTYGWSGTGENWVAVQANDTGDRGIEGDNNKSENGANPYSNPTLKNITLIGNGRSVTKDDVSKTIPGVKLREGTKGNLTNILVKNFSGNAFEIEHEQTFKNLLDGGLVISKIKVEGVAGVYKLKESKSLTEEQKTQITGKFDAAIDAETTGAGDLGTADWVKQLPKSTEE